MGTSAQALDSNQEKSLLALMNVLCLDDEGCETSVMAKHFIRDMHIEETRMVLNTFQTPDHLTELYLSFPTGKGKGGLMKLFRWTERRKTKLALGICNQQHFTIMQVSPGTLRDAADVFFNGMLPN